MSEELRTCDNCGTVSEFYHSCYSTKLTGTFCLDCMDKVPYGFFTKDWVHTDEDCDPDFMMMLLKFGRKR